MRRKKYDVTKLLTIKNFALRYVKKNGTVGVSRQYIEALINAKRNKGFDLVMIDGMKFISVLDASKVDQSIEVNEPEVEEIVEQPVEISIAPDEMEKPAVVTKDDLGEKPDVGPNQLSMF